MQVGSQIKKFRKIRKMSLAELAKTSAVQIATISRIENGKMTGTLESHLNIAKALSVDIAELYRDLQKEENLVPQNADDMENQPIGDSRSGQEILARQVTTKKMLPLIIKIEPKATTPEESQPLGTERFVFVLKGALTIHLKDQDIVLKDNSSLYFNAGLPHSFTNMSDTQSKFLSVSTPVNL